MTIRAFGLLLIATLAQQTNPADAARRKDVYAVYTTMMSYPPTSNDANDANRIFAIEAATKAAIPGSPCVVPPSSYAKQWEEVLADFNARKDTPAMLERSLNIAKPYLLLTPDEASGFVGSRRAQDSSAVPDSRLQGVRDIYRLSDVYFNKGRTLALTGIHSWCGTLCESGQWKIYEKASDGSWKEVRPARNCGMVA